MVSWAALGKYCQQVKGRNPSPLLLTGETMPGVLCPVLGSPVEERYAHTRESSMKDHKDDCGARASPAWGKAERAETF